MPTVLTLSPTYGGTRFGPFPDGIVTIGSDNSNHVVVPAMLGVATRHATLTGDGRSWTLQPVSMNTPIYVGKTALRSSAQLHAGDTFTLARPDGVTFTIEAGTIAAGVAEPARPRSGPRTGPPTMDELAKEARRQAEVEAMRNGTVQSLSQWYYRAKSGSLFQPRYIVAAVVALFGGAFTMCSGVVLWIVARLKGS